jgi:A/G-specific adenine glycosylase
MAVMRDAHRAVTPADLAKAWTDAEQRERALTSLVADGLIVAKDDGYWLP